MGVQGGVLQLGGPQGPPAPVRDLVELAEPPAEQLQHEAGQAPLLGGRQPQQRPQPRPRPVQVEHGAAPLLQALQPRHPRPAQQSDVARQAEAHLDHQGAGEEHGYPGQHRRLHHPRQQLEVEEEHLGGGGHLEQAHPLLLAERHVLEVHPHHLLPRHRLQEGQEQLFCIDQHQGGGGEGEGVALQPPCSSTCGHGSSAGAAGEVE